MTGDHPPGVAVGDVVVVDVGAVAHGGHCVARHEGQVLFVRHTLPGERVRARVTGLGPKGRFAHAEAVEVLQASPHRVQPPCPYAGPGRCGGCDLQHVDLAEQRRLKATVVREQLARLGGIEDVDVVCHPLPGDEDGLRWRTRVEFAVGTDGVGLRRHRSHEVLPLQDCLIASADVVGTGVLAGDAPRGVSALDVVAPSLGDPVVVPLTGGTVGVDGQAAGRSGGRPGRGRGGRGRRAPHTPARPAGPVPTVQEQVGPDRYSLSARGFWQVHPGAAPTFVAQVLTWLNPQEGESALDLYAGVGLFARPLAARVGPRGWVLAVEADRGAAESATGNLGDRPWASVLASPAERAVTDLVAAEERADLVVLDPPRTGAGAPVVRGIAALRPRAVVYVACDPAALARDLRTAAEEGLELVDLVAYDAFPMTHHVETLALLRPRPAEGVRPL
ncbi:class I SAM-dependent RNA methyltransferase [Ornithinimicrobium sp. W1665]|uniref:class I SAM-dependent RNA methyltransferase n=1 Tax=Ornithinimicrobium sp. W1665 TaxID=3416666 RepID=UPI003CEF6FAB